MNMLKTVSDETKILNILLSDVQFRVVEQHEEKQLTYNLIHYIYGVLKKKNTIYGIIQKNSKNCVDKQR